jgi:hypothetical protein
MDRVASCGFSSRDNLLDIEIGGSARAGQRARLVGTAVLSRV